MASKLFKDLVLGDQFLYNGAVCTVIECREWEDGEWMAKVKVDATRSMVYRGNSSVDLVSGSLEARPIDED